jgi:hypothetical protein
MTDFEMEFVFQINTYAFMKLEDAMAQPHGTAVDVAAVVASFGPTDCNYMPPHVVREICLADLKLVFIHLNANYECYCMSLII